MHTSICKIIGVALMAIFNCGRLLNADKPTAQLCKINIHKDTVLKTLNAAFPDITKGYLSSGNYLKQLGFKEAYYF